MDTDSRESFEMLSSNKTKKQSPDLNLIPSRVLFFYPNLTTDNQKATTYRYRFQRTAKLQLRKSDANLNWHHIGQAFGVQPRWHLHRVSKIDFDVVLFDDSTLTITGREAAISSNQVHPYVGRPTSSNVTHTWTQKAQSSSCDK